MPKLSKRIDRADGPRWLIFMLKISENLALGGAPTQGSANRIEIRRRVFAFTEPVAREGSGDNIGRLQIVALSNAESDTMIPQDCEHFFAKPRAVPKFESHPQSARIRFHKEGFKARHVDLEIGRKLEEHDTHPSSTNNRNEGTRQSGNCL